jgi:hypothetical protein
VRLGVFPAHLVRFLERELAGGLHLVAEQRQELGLVELAFEILVLFVRGFNALEQVVERLFLFCFLVRGGLGRVFLGRRILRDGGAEH